GDALIEDLLVTKSALYVVEIVDGLSRVRRFPLDVQPEPLAREIRTTKPKKAAKPGKKKGARPPSRVPPPILLAPGARGRAAALLPLPPEASVTGALTAFGDDLLLRVESFVEPAR